MASVLQAAAASSSSRGRSTASPLAGVVTGVRRRNTNNLSPRRRDYSSPRRATAPSQHSHAAAAAAAAAAASSSATSTAGSASASSRPQSGKPRSNVGSSGGAPELRSTLPSFTAVTGDPTGGNGRGTDSSSAATTKGNKSSTAGARRRRRQRSRRGRSTGVGLAAITDPLSRFMATLDRRRRQRDKEYDARVAVKVVQTMLSGSDVDAGDLLWCWVAPQ